MRELGSFSRKDVYMAIVCYMRFASEKLAQKSMSSASQGVQLHSFALEMKALTSMTLFCAAMQKRK
jgi:hypothetical protein